MRRVWFSGACSPKSSGNVCGPALLLALIARSARRLGKWRWCSASVSSISRQRQRVRLVSSMPWLGAMNRRVSEFSQQMRVPESRATDDDRRIRDRQSWYPTRPSANISHWLVDTCPSNACMRQNNDKHSTRDQIRGCGFVLEPSRPVHLTLLRRSLVASQRFEAAFSLALGNSDVELLAWLCSQLRPEDVFSSSAPMGQEVVLSLAQQLGCDLHNDPSTKAVWIRDAVLALDCTDPVLMPHIQAVLSELYAQLESEASSCDSGAQSELRLCMRVIKTQLRD